MAGRIIGVETAFSVGYSGGGGSPDQVVSRIQRLEEVGIGGAWLVGGPGSGTDALTVLAAAAARTERILLGTAIVPTWSRHPIAAAEQAATIAGIAPGRFRLGVGPSHKSIMEEAYGLDFRRPLTNLREYLQITRALLREGSVDFDGYHYSAHITDAPVSDLPVMASALRPKSFHLCGAESDGAISWVCPLEYLRDSALPALNQGAQEAGRPTPPLISHAAVCVHDDPSEVKEAALRDMFIYPQTDFYRKMFIAAGYPEAEETSEWSDRMLDAVLYSGSENQVADRLGQLFDIGSTELIITVVRAGSDTDASWERSLKLLAEVAKSS